MRTFLARSLALLRVWLAALLLAGPGAGANQVAKDTWRLLAAGGPPGIAARAAVAAGVGVAATLRRAPTAEAAGSAAGLAWAWGRNDGGQLGVNPSSITDAYSPLTPLNTVWVCGWPQTRRRLIR